MPLTKNSKGTIAFMLALALGNIWTSVSPVYDPPWEPWPPIVPFMAAFAIPFLQAYYRPILMALLGFVILWVWEGKRAGFLAAFIFSLIYSAFGLGIFILNAFNQQWLGTLTGVCAAVIPAGMALWYSYQGYRAQVS